MFGQWASSHTVCSRLLRTSSFSSRYSGPSWARTLIHSGMRRWGRTISVMVTSNPDAGRGPRLQPLPDVAEELPGHHSVDDPVVEGQAHVHHVPHGDSL